MVSCTNCRSEILGSNNHARTAGLYVFCNDGCKMTWESQQPVGIANDFEASPADSCYYCGLPAEGRPLGSPDYIPYFCTAAHMNLFTAFPCHKLNKQQWCDRNGLGGFMGHTCGTAEAIRIESVTSNPVSGSHYHRQFKGHDIDCHAIIELFELGYFTGTALTYIMRAGKKVDTPELTDIQKAIRTLQAYEAFLQAGGV